MDKYGDERVVVLQGDIGKSEDNEAVVRQAVNKWGGLDSLVLNAGQLDPVGKLKTHLERWPFDLMRNLIVQGSSQISLYQL